MSDIIWTIFMHDHLVGTFGKLNSRMPTLHQKSYQNRMWSGKGNRFRTDFFVGVLASKSNIKDESLFLLLLSTGCKNVWAK